MPILAGWLADDTSAGLMAAIGGFTALYGSGRAYLHRAGQLAAIALAFALATCLGLWAAPDIAPVVAVVALVAMAATWIGNALRIGPPGAYMFALACAAATAMPADHLTPVDAGLLVGSGGLFAWAGAHGRRAVRLPQAGARSGDLGGQGGRRLPRRHRHPG